MSCLHESKFLINNRLLIKKYYNNTFLESGYIVPNQFSGLLFTGTYEYYSTIFSGEEYRGKINNNWFELSSSQDFPVYVSNLGHQFGDSSFLVEYIGYHSFFYSGLDFKNYSGNFVNNYFNTNIQTQINTNNTIKILDFGSGEQNKEFQLDKQIALLNNFNSIRLYVWNKSENDWSVYGDGFININSNINKTYKNDYFNNEKNLNCVIDSHLNKVIPESNQIQIKNKKYLYLSNNLESFNSLNTEVEFSGEIIDRTMVEPSYNDIQVSGYDQNFVTFKTVFNPNNTYIQVRIKENSTSNQRYYCLQPLSNNAICISYSGDNFNLFHNQITGNYFTSYIGIPTGQILSGYKYVGEYYSGGLPWIINTGLYHINITTKEEKNNFWFLKEGEDEKIIGFLNSKDQELYVGNFWYNFSNWKYIFDFKTSNGIQYCLPCVESQGIACDFTSGTLLVYSNENNEITQTHSYFDIKNNHIYHGAYGINYINNVNSFINKVKQIDGSEVDLRTDNLNTNAQFIRINVIEGKYDNTWNNLNGAKFLTVNSNYYDLHPILIPIENNSYYVALALGHPDIDPNTIVFRGSDGQIINQRLVVVNPDGTINTTLSAPFDDLSMNFKPQLYFFTIYEHKNNFPITAVKMQDDRTIIIYSFPQNMIQREARDLTSVNIITGEKRFARIQMEGGIRGGLSTGHYTVLEPLLQKNYFFFVFISTGLNWPTSSQLFVFDTNINSFTDPNSLDLFVSQTPIRTFEMTNCSVVSIILDEDNGYAYFGLMENGIEHTGMKADGVDCYMIARMNISDPNPNNWFIDHSGGFDTITNSIQKFYTQSLNRPATCYLLGVDENYLYAAFLGTDFNFSTPSVEVFNGMHISSQQKRILKIRKNDAVILAKDCYDDSAIKINAIREIGDDNYDFCVEIAQKRMVKRINDEKLVIINRQLMNNNSPLDLVFTNNALKIL